MLSHDMNLDQYRHEDSVLLQHGGPGVYVCVRGMDESIDDDGWVGISRPI